MRSANSSLQGHKARHQALIVLLVIASLLFSTGAAQTRRPPRTITALTDIIYAIRFSPDSRTLAIARGTRDDNRVELWNAETGILEHTISGFDGAVWSVSFAPDGQTLVTSSGGIHSNKIASKPGAHDGRRFTELKWWDTQTGELRQRVELKGEDLVSVEASYSPDGKLLATAEQRLQTMLTTFDDRGPLGDPGSMRRTIPVRSSMLYGADLKLLDAKSGELRFKLKDGFSSYEMPMRGYPRSEFASMLFNQRYEPLAFSPDGQLVAAWNSSEIRLWSCANGKELRKLKNFKGRLNVVVFSPDSQTLAGAITKFSLKKNQPDFKSEIRIWDAGSGAARQVIPLSTQSATSLAFALNGQQFLIGGLDRDGRRSFATLELADLKSGSLGRLISKDEGAAGSIVLSPNGHTVAFQTDASTVDLLDTQSWKIKHIFEINGGNGSGNASVSRFLLSVKSVLAVAFSSDGKTVVGEIEQSGIKLWDPRTGEVKKKFTEHTEQTSLVDIAANATTVAQVFDNEKLSWLDISSGNETVFPEPDREMSAIGVSADGKVVAIARHDRIELLSTATRKSMRVLTAHGREIDHIAFSPDGGVFAASEEDGAIDVWNLKSGHERITINSAGKVTALRFAPGAKMLASAGEDGVVRLWDLETGTTVSQLKKHTAAVNALAFSSDGNLLASGGDDRTVVIWEIDKSKVRRTLKGHDLTVTSLAFSPDKSLLAVGSGNTSVVIWEVPTGKLSRILK